MSYFYVDWYLAEFVWIWLDWLIAHDNISKTHNNLCNNFQLSMLCACWMPYVVTTRDSHLYAVGAQKLVVVSHTVNALLCELECSKENSVDHARARHWNTETCKESVGYGEMAVSCKTYLYTSEGWGTGFWVSSACLYLLPDNCAGRYFSLCQSERSYFELAIQNMS